MTQSWIPKQLDKEKFFEKTERTKIKSRSKAVEQLNEETEENTTELFVRKLEQMSLLYDVPFGYLVPKAEMLKSGSLRFFYLDPTWIRVMLDGACSIGRNATIDYRNDETFLENIYQQAVSGNLNVRRELRGKQRVTQRDVEITECTGFLLSSPIVRNWRGLEFKAFSDENDQFELTVLRLETLSQEVLLGIYKGVIKRLEVREPPEAFHFGFKRDGSVLKKEMRSIDTGKLIDNSDITVWEKDNGSRVIDFEKTAQEMEKSKLLFPKGDGENKITSAHMALEMIQNPFTLEVTEKDK